MEPVTTDPKGENRCISVNTSALVKNKRSKEMGWYVTGFVDGEGSFLVSFSLRSKLTMGIEARPSFSLSQNKRNLEILNRLQQYFECGSIRFDRHDQTYKYESRSLDDLCSKIIPHFRDYPLQTSKNNDFKQFEVICRLMKSNQHRSPKGLADIIERAYKMNNLGARRYEKHFLLKIAAR